MWVLMEYIELTKSLCHLIHVPPWERCLRHEQNYPYVLTVWAIWRKHNTKLWQVSEVNQDRWTCLFNLWKSQIRTLLDLGLDLYDQTHLNVTVNCLYGWPSEFSIHCFIPFLLSESMVAPTKDKLFMLWEFGEDSRKVRADTYIITHSRDSREKKITGIYDGTWAQNLRWAFNPKIMYLPHSIRVLVM